MSTHWKTNNLSIQSRTKSHIYVIQMIMECVTNYLDIIINYIVLVFRSKKKRSFRYKPNTESPLYVKRFSFQLKQYVFLFDSIRGYVV